MSVCCLPENNRLPLLVLRVDSRFSTSIQYGCENMEQASVYLLRIQVQLSGAAAAQTFFLLPRYWPLFSLEHCHRQIVSSPLLLLRGRCPSEARGLDVSIASSICCLAKTGNCHVDVPHLPLSQCVCLRQFQVILCFSVLVCYKAKG